MAAQSQSNKDPIIKTFLLNIQDKITPKNKKEINELASKTFDDLKRLFGRNPTQDEFNESIIQKKEYNELITDSTKEQFISRFLQVNSADITPHNKKKIIEVLNQTYDQIVESYGKVPPQEYFNEIMLERLSVDKLIPYKCHFPPSISAKFDRIFILNDGNCLFHCIAEGLNITLQSNIYNQRMVRDEICDFMKQYKDTFLSYNWFNTILTADGKNFQKYISDMKQDGTWGDLAVIIAAIKRYKRPINLYTKNGEPFYSFEKIKEDETTFPKGSYPDDVPINLYWCSKDQTIDEGRHYELLIPKDMAKPSAAAAASDAAPLSAQLSPQLSAPAASAAAGVSKPSKIPLPKASIPSGAAVLSQEEQDAELARVLEKKQRQEEQDAELARSLETKQRQEEQLRKDAELAKKLSMGKGGGVDKYYLKYLKYKEKYLALKKQNI